MKKVIITIRKIEDKININTDGVLSVLDCMLLAARLLVIAEKMLPEDVRAGFRADFLEELNRQRREELEEIENC